MAKLKPFTPEEAKARAQALLNGEQTSTGIQWLGGSGPGIGGGVGFNAPFGPGYMPAGVPPQFTSGYQSGPNPVFGNNGIPSGVPGAGAPGGGGGGFSFPTTWSEAGDALKNFGGWLLENPEVPLAVVGGIQGYRAQRDANKNDQRALALLEQRQAQLAPLSAAGIAGLTAGMGGARPDLSHLVDDANPYARSFAPVGRVGGGGGGGAAGSTRSRRG